jgi:short-subunit dehydrogenase
MDWIACVGAFVLVSKVISLACTFLSKPKTTLEVFKYGWVVITGATDGIGLAYATELAKRGFKLILVSRSAEKLLSVATKLTQQFATEVEVISADFSACHIDSEAFFAKIKSRLDNFEVSVLINNVGLGPCKAFGSQEWDEIERTVAVNIYPQVMLTHIVLPQMTSRYASTKQQSLILNVSSSSVFMNVDDLALYAATKKFNLHFSKSISYEVEDQGVFVNAVTPGYVDTPLLHSQGLKLGNPMVVTSEAFVKASLKQFWKKETVGHISHKVSFILPLLMPLEWRGWLTSKVHKLGKHIKLPF